MRGLEIKQAGASPVTLANFKTFLKIDSSDEDSILETLLSSATEAIQNNLKRVLVDAEYDLWLDEFPATQEKLSGAIVADFRATGFIWLPFPPTILVKSIKTYNKSNTESTLSSSYYSIDQQNGRIYLNTGYSWPTDLRDINAVKINFTCGFDSECPEVLKQAVMMYAAQMYNDRCDCNISGTVKKMISGYKLYDRLGA